MHEKHTPSEEKLEAFEAPADPARKVSGPTTSVVIKLPSNVLRLLNDIGKLTGRTPSQLIVEAVIGQARYGIELAKKNAQAPTSPEKPE